MVILLFVILFISTIFCKDIRMARNTYRYFMDDILIRPPSNICDVIPGAPVQVNVYLRMSFVMDFNSRQKCRKRLTPGILRSYSAVQLFLLAGLPSDSDDMSNQVSQSDIENESIQYGDILQGNFIDDFRNQTHKHLMGLRWVTKSCRHARFIVKVDDSINFDFDSLQEFSLYFDFADKISYDRSNVLRGIIQETNPVRDKNSPLYVSREEFAGDQYPVHAWAGFYVTTPEVADLLCNEAIYHSYLHIDGAFITGILRKAIDVEVKDVLVLFEKFDDYDFEEYNSVDVVKTP